MKRPEERTVPEGDETRNKKLLVGETHRFGEALKEALPSEVLHRIGGFIGWQYCESVATCLQLLETGVFRCFQLQADNLLSLNQFPHSCKGLEGVWLKHGDFLSGITKIHGVRRLGLEKMEMRTLNFAVSELQETRHLWELALVENPLGDHGLEQICDGLRQCTMLKRVELVGCRLSSAALTCLSDALQCAEGLTHLDLSFNIFGETCGGGLEQLVQKTSLRSLDLTYCGLGSSAVIQLCEGLKDVVTLQYLNLSDNKIRDDGAVAVARLLANGKCDLTELEMRSCRVGDKGSSALILALRDARLKKLNLAENRIRGPMTRLALSVSFSEFKLGSIQPNLPSLVELSLSNCYLDDFAAFALAKYISSRASRLERLDVSNNFFGSAGVQALVDNLKKRGSLRFINLAGNHHKTIQQMSTSLPHMHVRIVTENRFFCKVH